MKKYILVIFLCAGHMVLAQGSKKLFSNTENLLKAIIPNSNPDSWTVIRNIDGKNTVIRPENPPAYENSATGFVIDQREHGYYYIAYTKGGQTRYITDAEGLRKFIGDIDNPQEAALAAVAKGYVIDFEYQDVAANYTDNGASYTVHAGKVMSLDCPFEINHYALNVDKKTGAVTGETDMGKYFELYGKECENNPHYSALQKQMEEARLKAEEQKKIQKEMTDKMERRIRKIQSKRR